MSEATAWGALFLLVIVPWGLVLITPRQSPPGPTRRQFWPIAFVGAIAYLALAYSWGWSPYAAAAIGGTGFGALLIARLAAQVAWRKAPTLAPLVLARLDSPVKRALLVIAFAVAIAAAVSAGNDLSDFDRVGMLSITLIGAALAAALLALTRILDWVKAG